MQKILKNPLFSELNMHLIKITISEPKRPIIPDYGISENSAGLVSWDDVNRWMELSHNYWINTIRGSFPHSRPVWGIWHENIFYFGGGSETRNAKNLLKNNNISVHTESGEKVAIIEGYAEQFSDDDLHQVLGELYEKKYKMFHPPPFWRVIPKKVFAWQMSDFANTPTKFLCKVE
jgi:general stress protein 26